MDPPVTFGRVIPHAVQGARGRRWGWWYYAVYRVSSMRAYWPSIVGYGVVVPVLYLLAMGLGLGTLVDAHAGSVEGVAYLAFVGPSLLVTSAVMEVSGEFTYGVMDNFKWRKVYYGVIATPAGPGQIAIGELVAVSARLAAQSGAFWVILVVSGSTTPGWSVLTVPIAVLAAMSFGAPLIAFTATRERDDFSFSFIQRFLVMPMFLFAGTFFPLASMPAYLQWIGWISPMWHGTQLARAVCFGLPLSGGQVVVHVAFLTVLTGVGTALAIVQFRRRLTR